MSYSRVGTNRLQHVITNARLGAKPGTKLHFLITFGMTDRPEIAATNKGSSAFWVDPDSTQTASDLVVTPSSVYKVEFLLNPQLLQPSIPFFGLARCVLPNQN